MELRCPAKSLTLIFAGCLSVSGCNTTTSREQDAAENALPTFELEEGFEIELVASEPLIRDPVDMEIDEHGNFYVVEMPGYPLDIGGSGKIKMLYDTDADGRMDKSSVFAENLILPNSVMRWKKGVLVTDAPHLLYFEDSDSDGVADIRDTLLTGFALSNPQHNLNSPVLGLDNWIYLSHEGSVSTQAYEKEFGDEGSEIYYPSRPDSPRLDRNANGRSVRFRPDDFALEVISSHSQFGHTFDAWGHHLLVSNANHIYHEVIAQSYLRRNPALAISEATQSVSDHADAAEVFPITEDPRHQLLTDVGVITSACGLTAYLGGAFPPPYDKNVTFVAEPVSNLVHVDKIKEAGVTFRASRVHAAREFLASTDARFRPVNLYVGPDGALYVVDYYRQIIEHPEWMGEEVIASGDLYNDSDKGRIYRISAKNRPVTDREELLLAQMTDLQLVGQLANPNLWWRQHAQRLLIDRRNTAIIPSIAEMTSHSSALARLHALWTLEGLDALDEKQIVKALGDPEPGVRENAVRLAELHMKNEPALLKGLLLLKSDPSARVRFQLLCTLGFIDSKEAETARNEILFDNLDDKWIQIAAMSGASPSGLLKVVIKNFDENVPAYRSLVQRLSAAIVASENNPSTKDLLQISLFGTGVSQQVRAAIMEGLSQGINTNAVHFVLSEHQQTTLFETFFNSVSPETRRASLGLLKKVRGTNVAPVIEATSRAAAIAEDRGVDDVKRADAIDLLSIGDARKHEALLKKLMEPNEPLNIQLAALRTLSGISDTAISVYLLQKWPELTPQMHDAAINTFLTDEVRISILLSALEQGTISAAHVSWPRRVSLMAQANQALRTRARAIFTRNNDDEINESYRPALDLRGSPENGKDIYMSHCARCHQIRGASGISIGPDLGTVHNWSPDAIMANTLAPNLSISSGYDLWTVTLKTGEAMQGIISSETPGAITLRNIDRPDKTINRENIRSLKAMNMSIMPDDISRQINQQEMADLLAFLKKNK